MRVTQESAAMLASRVILVLALLAVASAVPTLNLPTEAPPHGAAAAPDGKIHTEFVAWKTKVLCSAQTHLIFVLLPGRAPSVCDGRQLHNAQAPAPSASPFLRSPPAISRALPLLRCTEKKTWCGPFEETRAWQCRTGRQPAASCSQSKPSVAKARSLSRRGTGARSAPEEFCCSSHSSLF